MKHLFPPNALHFHVFWRRISHLVRTLASSIQTHFCWSKKLAPPLPVPFSVLFSEVPGQARYLLLLGGRKRPLGGVSRPQVTRVGLEKQRSKAQRKNNSWSLKQHAFKQKDMTNLKHNWNVTWRTLPSSP